MCIRDRAGLAVGGLVVATGGAIYGAIHGIGAIVPFIGLSALKTFAIGALAFNQFAFLTAPILGLSLIHICFRAGRRRKVCVFSL